DEGADPFGDALDFVDQVFVFAEPAQRAFAALDALGGRVDVGQGAFEVVAGAVDLVDDLANLTALLGLPLVFRHELAHVFGGHAHVLQDPVDLGRPPFGDALDVLNDIADGIAVLAHGPVERIRDVGEVLEGIFDILFAALGADGLGERVGDSPHVLGNQGDFTHQVVGGRGAEH